MPSRKIAEVRTINSGTPELLLNTPFAPETPQHQFEPAYPWTEAP